MISQPRRCRNLSSSSEAVECRNTCWKSSISLGSLLQCTSPLTLPLGTGSVMKRSHDEDSLCSSSSMAIACTRPSSSHPAPASKIPHRVSTDSHSKLSHNNKIPKSVEMKSSNNNCSAVNCEVFLGGSCNPTTWRSEIAIPMLKNLGITYFNPQVASWCPELMEAEHKAKDGAHILLFVIDNQTRAVAAMVEVAYLVAQGKNVILVITGLKGSGQLIMGEPISQSELEDLTCGQLVLQDLVERHEIPVFNDIAAALRCSSQLVQEGLKLRDLNKLQEKGPSHLTSDNTSKLKFLICSKLKRTFDSLAIATSSERIMLSDIPSAYKSVMNHDLVKEDVTSVLEELNGQDTKDCSTPIIEAFAQLPTKSEPDSYQTSNADTMPNFEQFCCIMIALMYNQRKTKIQPSSNNISLIATSYYANMVGLLNKLLEHLPSSKTTALNPPKTQCESESIESKPEEQKRDVYLGGVCDSNESWRTDEAIPLLKTHGLTYWNPECTSPFLPLDSTRISDCTVLLFYLSRSARALDSLVMASYYIGLKRDVVLCVEHLNEESKIRGESLTKLAVKDYNRGRSYISDIARRDGISVFDNLKEALECAVSKCPNSRSTS